MIDTSTPPETFTARIVAVDEAGIALDTTGFQPSTPTVAGDLGWLDDRPVISTLLGADGVVRHRVAAPPGDLWSQDLEGVDGFVVGRQVAGRVDPARRLALMRAHTASSLTQLAFGALHGATAELVKIEPNRVDLRVASVFGELPAAATLWAETVESWTGECIRDDVALVRIEDLVVAGCWHVGLDGHGYVRATGPTVRRTGEVGRVSVRPGRSLAAAAEFSVVVGA